LKSLKFEIIEITHKVSLFFHFLTTYTHMKNGYLRALSLALFLFGTSFIPTISAQNWEVGTTIGGSLYNGDIDVTPLTATPQIRFGGGIFVGYHINNWLGIRLQANAGTLFADEKQYGSSAWKTRRGFAFSSPIYELALMPQIHPIRMGRFEPFAFVGLAVASFSPTTNYNDPNPTADVDRTINERIALDKITPFSTVTMAIPIGGGVRWFPSDRFAVGFEVGGRKTFSDFIDRIQVSSGGSAKDFYFFGGINLSYFFGGGDGFSGDWWSSGGKRRAKVGCPTF
jgi:Outer membrane protein beta-barrel domain